MRTREWFKGRQALQNGRGDASAWVGWFMVSEGRPIGSAPPTPDGSTTLGPGFGVLRIDADQAPAVYSHSRRTVAMVVPAQFQHHQSAILDVAAKSYSADAVPHSRRVASRHRRTSADWLILPIRRKCKISADTSFIPLSSQVGKEYPSSYSSDLTNVIEERSWLFAPNLSKR